MNTSYNVFGGLGLGFDIACLMLVFRNVWSLAESFGDWKCLTWMF
jgi:hypothetical protein